MKKNFTSSIVLLVILFYGNASFSQAPPVYDNCVAALPLQTVVSASCSGAVDFSDVMATPTAAGIIPVPACGNFTDGITPDVWFTFTSGNVSDYQVNVDPGSTGSADDPAIAVYTGGCAGPWTLLGCDDNSNGAGMPSLSVLSLSPGTECYVRVWSNDGSTPGNFRLCVVTNVTAVGENEFAEALQVFPSPIENVFTINIPPGFENCFLQIFNALGELVLSRENVAPGMQLNASSLDKGIYSLSITSDKISVSRKIAKL